MTQKISLDFFETKNRCYHIYKLNDSAVAKEFHHHDYFQVCFVSRGEILHEHDSDSSSAVSLCQGDAFIIPPYFSHRLRFMKKDSEIYSLSFNMQLFHSGFSFSNIYKFLDQLQAFSSCESGEIIRLKVSLNKSQRQNVHSLFDCLLREQVEESVFDFSAAASLIAASLCTIAQGYYQQPQNINDYKEMIEYNAIFSKCIEYINTHYKEEISLSGLAKLFMMSKSTFSSKFPQFTGLSLKEYIRQKRIFEAEVLIQTEPNLSLNEIGAAVGYDDGSTFYRNFVRVAGMSPSEYKQIYQHDK